MKKIIAAAMILMGSSALANTTILTCTVPESSSVSITIDDAGDGSVDFMTIYLNEKSSQSVFFSQTEKGNVAAQLKNGFLNLLALTDKSAQEDGVIKNTGFLGLSKENDSTFGGFLAASGNIYPLSCTMK